MVRGGLDPGAVFISTSLSVVCFYFIAGCLGYLLPEHTGSVRHACVAEYFWKACSVGGPAHQERVCRRRCRREVQWRHKNSKEGKGQVAPSLPAQGGRGPSSREQEWEPEGPHLPWCPPHCRRREGGRGSSFSSCQAEAGRKVCACVSQSPADAPRALRLVCTCVGISTEWNKPPASFLYVLLWLTPGKCLLHVRLKS